MKFEEYLIFIENSEFFLIFQQIIRLVLFAERLKKNSQDSTQTTQVATPIRVGVSPSDLNPEKFSEFKNFILCG